MFGRAVLPVHAVDCVSNTAPTGELTTRSLRYPAGGWSTHSGGASQTRESEAAADRRASNREASSAKRNCYPAQVEVGDQSELSTV